MSSCFTTLLVHLPSCSQTDQGQGRGASGGTRGEAGRCPRMPSVRPQSSRGVRAAGAAGSHAVSEQQGGDAAKPK